MTDATDEPAVARVGDRIPDFTAESTGGTLKLSDFRGRKLVLYFYPKDSTPGCTTQGSDFGAAHAKFRKAGTEILGVSRDSLKSHANFKSKMSFPFELVSDPDESLCRRFGVPRRSLRARYRRRERRP